MTRRREFVGFLWCAALAWPLAAGAQQNAMPVIGVLGATSPSQGGVPRLMDGFRQGLKDTGYVERQNLAVEYRWAEGRYDRLPELAADLVRRKVDLIVAIGGALAASAARNATATIPIVFTGVGDPVGQGLVASLARPGGNLTGYSNFFDELTSKRLELLSELVPQAKVIALLVNPNNRGHEGLPGELREAARRKGVALEVLWAGSADEIDATFATLVRRQVGALVVGADPFFETRLEQLVALTARHAVVAIHFLREFVAAGGLVSYGPSVTSVRRQVGVYAGRILKGENPADLPVVQPTEFELVMNLRTARALGLAPPPSLLARADEVIE